MNVSPGSPNAFTWFLSRIAAARFMSLSLAIHAILIVLGGSLVLFKVTQEPPDFESDSGGLVVDAGVSEAPPETQESPTFAQSAPQAPTLAAPVIAIATTAPTTWKVSARPDAQIRGVSDSIKGTLATLGGGAGAGGMGGGGLGAGGLGRLGGSRTAMIFGKKVTAAKLGVILDVSGSAHPHIAGAVTEIQKGFKDAALILYPGCGMTDFDGNSEHKIRKYSSITKRDLEKGKGKFTTPGQLVAALKIEAFEEMTKRASMKDTLFVSWYDDKDGNPQGLIGRTQVAFDDLLKRNVDTIYWFADFADKVDAEVAEKLSAQLAAKKIALHVHNFAGKKINPLVTGMAEKSGGTVNTEKPQ